MIDFAAFATFAVLLGHGLSVIALLHARAPLAPVLIHAASAVVWHLVQITTLLVLGAINYYWHCAAFFALGVMLFVFGFSAVYKSISLRLLVVLAQTPGKAIAMVDIQEQLVLKNFRERATMLTATGLVVLTPEGYLLSESGRRMAHKIQAVRALFGAKASGLYFEKPAKQ